MEFSHFHFENPLWLWGLLLIPLVGVMYKFFYKPHSHISRLEEFIDKELLPHLLINSGKSQHSFWRSLLLGSLLWTLLIGALAGPRWMYHEVETFSPDQSLCILLDVSKSMDASDVKPSRLMRARQKIEDILNQASGVKIALIAFAADPHLISPLTDDRETIRHFLPSLGTDLVYLQGSKLSPALTMASRLLGAAPGHNKSILIISDGGFEDGNAITMAHKLAQEGLKVYTLGVGTPEGAPLQEATGNFIKKQGNTVISKLEKDQLQAISKAGNGQYLELHYADEDVRTLLAEITGGGKTEEKTHQMTRQWEDHFYLLIFPVMGIVLFWFRKGFVFPLIFFCILGQAKGTNFQDLFQNEAQLGKQAFEQGDYEGAIKKFRDPYHQGVAQYKAGHFATAEKLFRDAQRPEISTDSLYNLGNALARQEKLEEAVAAYEKVLEKKPDHQKAKDNLEILKVILEQKKKQNDQDQDQKKEEPKQEEENKESDNQNKDKQDQDTQSEDGSKSKEKQKQNNSGSEKEGSSSENPSKEQAPSQEKSDEKPSSNQSPSSLKENNEDQNSEKEEGKAQETGQGRGSEEEEKGSDKKSSPDKEGENKEPSPDKGGENKEPLQEENKGSESSHQMDSQDLSHQKMSKAKTGLDMDADQWLDQITNDPKSFLKNQFYIESQQNGSKEGTEPW